MSATPIPRVTYNASEVARGLGVSPQTVTKMVREGILPALDVGEVNRVLIPVAAVDELVQASLAGWTRRAEVLRAIAAGQREVLS